MRKKPFADALVLHRKDAKSAGLLLTLIGLSWLGSPVAEARNFRVAQLPNGSAFNCGTCHVSSAGGGPRNPFGQAVQAITGSSSVAFWSASLAAKDSDGDGSSNGVELGDPEGDGTATPGWKVTNPGSASSKPVNASPTVTIVSPPQDLTLPAPAVIGVAANAADTDGSIAKVEFFDNGTLVGTDTQSPFSMPVDLGVGSHVITSKATDNLGAATTSTPVNVSVAAPPPVALGTPTLNAGQLALTWTGGEGPFLVETTADLATPWGGTVQGVTGRAIQVPVQGAAAFVRVADTAGIGPVPMGASLSGASERPTPVSTTATGTGTFTLQNNTLTFTISYSGLSSPATAAHIHGPAGMEQNAPPMIDLAPFNGGTFGVNGTIAGSVILTAEQKAALLSGQTYVNIHTGNFGAGEIRGQVGK